MGVPITLARGLLMLSLRLMLMLLFSMVPMDMVVLAMLVLAMLAMLDILDTPMPMEVTPMPMVPTATLDKKFILFLQLHSETIYYPRAYQLQQPQNDYHLQNLPHNQ